MFFIEKLFTDPLTFSSTVLIVLISISIHELAHGYAAINQGDDTPKELGHMTWNPVTHMGWNGIICLLLLGISWGKMPVNPSNFKNGQLSNMIVSFAGPFSNMLLCILFSCLVLFITKNTSMEASYRENLFYVFYIGAILNFILFVFNLLPVPPLDGYHIFQEIFPPLKSLSKITYLPLIFLVIILNVPQFWDALVNMGDNFIEQILINLNLLF